MRVLDAEVHDLKRVLRSAGADLLDRLRRSLWCPPPEVSLPTPRPPTSPEERLDPGLLARLMDLGARGRLARRPEEMARLLQEQLAAPLRFDLGGLDEVLTRQVDESAVSAGVALRSFADLLHHPQPPLDPPPLPLGHPPPARSFSLSLWERAGVRVVRFASRLYNVSCQSSTQY